MRYSLLLVSFYLAVTSRPSAAGIQSFDDQVVWEDAVAELGTFSTITFTELPDDTFVTDQYLEMFGVNFVGPPAQIKGPGCKIYPEDCFGLDAWPANPAGTITIEFSTPQHWIAANYPGGILFELYQGDTLIETARDFPFSGFGFFGGLISDTWFDRVVIDDPFFGVEIDNLYFGGPVPAPSALLILLAGSAIGSRRRPS